MEVPVILHTRMTAQSLEGDFHCGYCLLEYIKIYKVLCFQLLLHLGVLLLGEHLILHSKAFATSLLKGQKVWSFRGNGWWNN